MIVDLVEAVLVVDHDVAVVVKVALEVVVLKDLDALNVDLSVLVAAFLVDVLLVVELDVSLVLVVDHVEAV